MADGANADIDSIVATCVDPRSRPQAAIRIEEPLRRGLQRQSIAEHHDLSRSRARRVRRWRRPGGIVRCTTPPTRRPIRRDLAVLEISGCATPERCPSVATNDARTSHDRRRSGIAHLEADSTELGMSPTLNPPRRQLSNVPPPASDTTAPYRTSQSTRLGKAPATLRRPNLQALERWIRPAQHFDRSEIAISSAKGAAEDLEASICDVESMSTFVRPGVPVPGSGARSHQSSDIGSPLRDSCSSRQESWRTIVPPVIVISTSSRSLPIRVWVPCSAKASSSYSPSEQGPYPGPGDGECRGDRCVRAFGADDERSVRARDLYLAFGPCRECSLRELGRYRRGGRRGWNDEVAVGHSCWLGHSASTQPYERCQPRMSGGDPVAKRRFVLGERVLAGCPIRPTLAEELPHVVALERRLELD